MSANNENSTGAFLAGFIIGGFVGAAAALVLAPQSGGKTREQLVQQGEWLRDSAYRQRAHGVDTFAQNSAEAVADAADAAEDAIDDAPRIILNGGHVTTTDSAATDEESNG